MSTSIDSDSTRLPQGGSLEVASTVINRDPVKVLLGYFSNWIPLCNSVAWLLRLQRTIRQKHAGKPLPKGPLLCGKMKAATVEVVKLVQREAFSKEIQFLKEDYFSSEEVLQSQRKPIPQSSLN
jgi:hypothetical protein